MDLQSFDKAFTYYPNTPEQDEDLEEIYRQAKRLATAIRERIDEKRQDQILMQLVGVVQACRTTVELSPRQLKPLVVV